MTAIHIKMPPFLVYGGKDKVQLCQYAAQVVSVLAFFDQK